MVSSSRIGKIVLLLFTVLCISCQDQSDRKPDQFLNYHFQDGDIVLRYGNGFTSKYFRDLSQSEKIYSHVGLIKVSNDSVYVFHSEASEYTSIGKVRKETMSAFLRKVNLWAIYRIEYDSLTKVPIIKKAQEYYEANTPFDMDFDLSNDHEVYCTEFVANCINVGIDSIIINTSINKNNKRYYGVDDIYKPENINKIYSSALVNTR